MLLRNDLLHYMHPSPRTVRILWISPDQSHAYVFDVAAKSADVELLQIPVLNADLRSGRATVLADDPYLLVLSQELLPAKYLELRARAWDIVEPLVAMEPDIYEARRRGQLVAQATAAHGVSHPTIYRYLRRYWQRGQTPNALLPDYANSGGRGKVRAVSAGVKRGRPRKDGADPGLNADEDIRRIFRVATAHYAAGRQKFSRLGAYQQMLDDFFRGRRIDPASGRVLDGAPDQPAVLPTFGQYNYWLDQDDDRPSSVSRRSAAGQHVVDQAAAALNTGAGFAPQAMQALPPGRPGSSFYLDAVQAEVQLVSRTDRGQAIGRPLIYLATDTFSRMVTGLYVGMAPVSRQQAMLALANCGADKQRYCAQFGRSIEPDAWPCRHLPETLFVSGALTGGWSGDTLLNNFNLRCLAADAGPDDWKAVLEKRFRLLAPDAQGAPGRLDGVLDLDQFIRIVIDGILYYNSRRLLPHVAGATPQRLWDWGVAHRGGGLKTYPEHLIRCSLLPVTQALVTADGIHLYDSNYSCARAVDERWFERVRQRGQWQVKVAYDPSDLDRIYLLDLSAPMQFHACELVDAGRKPRRLALAEVVPLQGSAGHPNAAEPNDAAVPAPGGEPARTSIMAGFVG